MLPILEALFQRRTAHKRADALNRTIRFERVAREGLAEKIREAEETLEKSVAAARKAIDEVNKNYETYNKFRVSSQAQIEEYREKEKVMQETIKSLLLSVELNNKCREAEISHQVRIISAQGVRNS